jgi:hypothetical protein
MLRSSSRHVSATLEPETLTFQQLRPPERAPTPHNGYTQRACLATVSWSNVQHSLTRAGGAAATSNARTNAAASHVTCAATSAPRIRAAQAGARTPSSAAAAAAVAGAGAGAQRQEAAHGQARAAGATEGFADGALRAGHRAGTAHGQRQQCGERPCPRPAVGDRASSNKARSAMLRRAPWPAPVLRL